MYLFADGCPYDGGWQWVYINRGELTVDTKDDGVTPLEIVFTTVSSGGVTPAAISTSQVTASAYESNQIYYLKLTVDGTEYDACGPLQSWRVHVRVAVKIHRVLCKKVVYDLAGVIRRVVGGD